ncbi:MAG: hypothetical protein NWE95_13065 [Candidatus Bathyarchaeota archaeon]|nr:hypothetical protein [Candidatus Bathyarchaeota archaeon]
MVGVFIGVWGFLGYIAISEGVPVIVYVLLPILVAIGASILGMLIYALVKTPPWLKRFEQRFFGEG